jgi:hypothetical protein
LSVELQEFAMKVLVGAAISALLFAGVAFAQTDTAAPATAAAPATPLPTQCGAIATAPTIPDGHHATAAQMHAADTAYRAWATDTETKLHCRAAEVETVNRQVQASVAAYQAQAASARTVSDAYNASITAFNGRGASAHVDDTHHGGLVSSHD